MGSFQFSVFSFQKDVPSRLGWGGGMNVLLFIWNFMLDA
jgi:hypothetical protein